MEKIIKSNQLDIWTESFGDKNNPSMLLIMGTAGQGILWTDDFCEKLAKEFFVIRYDHRDTGKSAHINYMLKPYGLSDLAKDAIDILDNYEIEKAHIIGSSMGGYIAQICMRDNPTRLLSSTIMMSTVDFSPIGKSIAGTLAANDLPAPNSSIMEGLKSLGTIDIADYEKWLIKSLKAMKLFNGDAVPFDKSEWLPILEKTYARRDKNIVPTAIHNHVIACSQGPLNFYNVKASCPVHIIHGSSDPIFAIEHAQKTAKHYDAKLTIIENMGHLRPKIFEDEIASCVMDFCKK